uniref:Uncharacterized protein n=1 Tax=Oryza nivara TaxID=4536 RepID=A0A0E0J2Z1_ORYNI
MAPGPSSDPHRARPLQPSPTISGSGKGAVDAASSVPSTSVARQPALRTSLAPEKRLLVWSGTEGSFTKFINASYKSECLELYEMMDEYCRIGRRHITSSKNQGIKDLPVNICEYAFSYIYETVQTHPEDLADNVFHCWSKVFMYCIKHVYV